MLELIKEDGENGEIAAIKPNTDRQTGMTGASGDGPDSKA
jgi:hypothetical protein